MTGTPPIHRPLVVARYRVARRRHFPSI